MIKLSDTRCDLYGTSYVLPPIPSGYYGIKAITLMLTDPSLGFRIVRRR